MAHTRDAFELKGESMQEEKRNDISHFIRLREKHPQLSNKPQYF